MDKYYVFMSYSRKDLKAAAYLKQQLEQFRIPAKLVPPEVRPAGQEFVCPVFHDKQDLLNTEGSFKNDIKAALEDSRYLLVLCSPSSANSQWVNEEIRLFLNLHNGDYSKIVPVILKGRPGSGGVDECLPPALHCEEITSRNLPTMIPDVGEPLTVAWENGLVQALCFMLKVDRETIKECIQKGSSGSEKLRQMKTYAAISVVAIAIFAALATWALHAERQSRKNADLAQKNEARAMAAEKLARENAELVRKYEATAKANEARAISENNGKASK